MKICFVSRRFFPAISGMSTYAYNLVNNLIYNGHSVTVISQFKSVKDYNPYNDGPPILINNVKIVGLEAKGEHRCGNFEEDIKELVLKIIEYDKYENFDVIHAQFAYPPGFAALEAGKILHKPVAISIQGGDGHWFGSCCEYHKEIMKLILNNAEAIIVGTNSFAKEIIHNNETKRNFIILPGAVDTDMFKPKSNLEREKLRHCFGIRNNTKVILYHGRIDWRKGLRDLIDAISILRNKYSNFLLLISGIGPDENELQEIIKQLNLHKFIRYLGYVSYFRSHLIYGLADIFCNPTYGEGFSNTILEAWSTGIPVISTRVTGVIDAIEDGKTGILVNPNNPEKLSNAILELLLQEKLCQKLTYNGRLKVTECFSWKKLVNKISNVYKEVLHNKNQKYWDNSNLSKFSTKECIFRRCPHLL
jgi:glycosyltransferase involved in cell wall biosynthesis